MKARNKLTVALLTVASAAAFLTACTAGTDAPPINYEPGELSGTDQNFAADMAACLKESGWEVEVGPDNSVNIQLREDQADAYDAANEACSESLGYDEEPEPLTDAQMKRLYQGLLALSGCLSDKGHEVRDIPSEQAFIDGAVFDPYGELRDPARADAISNDQYYELLETCPRP